LYHSVDNADNQEDLNLEIIKIDKIAPSTELKVTPCFEWNGKLYVESGSEVSLIGSDTNSGMSLTLYRIDHNEWINYEAPFILNNLYTEFLIEYYSTDIAGNTEPVKETTIMVEEVFHGEGKLKLEYKELWGDAIMTISKDLIRMEIGDEIIVWEIITSEEKDGKMNFYGVGILGDILVKLDLEKNKLSATGTDVTFKSKD
jgi:hypothetical protein